MSPDRAYLIISRATPPAASGPGSAIPRTRPYTRVERTGRTPRARRLRPAAAPVPRPRRGVGSGPADTAGDLIRILDANPHGNGTNRRHDGRHRLGTPGLRPYRLAGRRRPPSDRTPPRRAQHTAGTRQSPPPVPVPRYATLLALLVIMFVSGWFAASGATAFAQIMNP